MLDVVLGRVGGTGTGQLDVLIKSAKRHVVWTTWMATVDIQSLSTCCRVVGIHSRLLFRVKYDSVHEQSDVFENNVSAPGMSGLNGDTGSIVVRANQTNG